MEQVKNISVYDLLKLLPVFVKENANRMKHNNLKALKLSKQGILNSDVRQQKAKLYRFNAILTSENKKFINLHNHLLDFYKCFGKRIENVVTDEPVNYRERDFNNTCNIQFLGYTTQNRLHEEKKSKSNFKSKSIQQLNELLHQFISEERYEECGEIQKIINAKAKNSGDIV